MSFFSFQEKGTKKSDGRVRSASAGHAPSSDFPQVIVRTAASGAENFHVPIIQGYGDEIPATKPTRKVSDGKRDYLAELPPPREEVEWTTHTEDSGNISTQTLKDLSKSKPSMEDILPKEQARPPRARSASTPNISLDAKSSQRRGSSAINESFANLRMNHVNTPTLQFVESESPGGRIMNTLFRQKSASSPTQRKWLTPSSEQFNIMRPLSSIFNDPTSPSRDDRSTNTAWAGFGGYVEVKDKSWNKRWLQLDEAVLYLSKCTNSSTFLFTKSITELKWTHVCPQNTTDGRKYQFHIKDDFSEYYISVNSAEELDLWLSALVASKMQQLITYYFTTHAATVSDAISDADLNLFEASLRPILRSWGSISEEYLQSSLGLLSSALGFHPRRQEVVNRISRAGSWAFTTRFLASMEESIGRGRYYSESVMHDKQMWSEISEKEEQRIIRELQDAHLSCAPVFELLALDKTFLDADYHQMYRCLYERLVQYETQLAHAENEPLALYEYVAKLSRSSTYLLESFSNFYGISENFQQLTVLDTYVKSLYFSAPHLTVIAEKAEFLVSRVKGQKSLSSGDYYLTKLEVDGLLLIMEKLQALVTRKLGYFMGHFPGNNPKGCISQLIRILLHAIVLEYKLYPQPRPADQSFREVLTELVRTSATKNCERIMEAVRIGSLHPSETTEVDLSPETLTPIQYLDLLELILAEHETLLLYTNEFPSSVDFMKIILKEYYNVLSNETLFTANAFSKGHTDPVTALGICKLWKALSPIFVPLGPENSKPLPVDVLFEDSLMEWIEVRFSELTNELHSALETLETDSTSPKPSDYVVLSLNDIMTTMVDSLEAEALNSTRSIGMSILETFAMKSCTVVQMLCSSLHLKVMLHFQKDSLVLNEVEDEVLESLNDVDSALESLDGLLCRVFAEKVSILSLVWKRNYSLEQFVPQGFQGALIDAIGPIKELAYMITDKIVEAYFASQLHEYTTVVKRVVENKIAKENEAKKILRNRTKSFDRNTQVNVDPSIYGDDYSEVSSQVKAVLHGMGQMLAIFNSRLSGSAFQDILERLWEGFVSNLHQIVFGSCVSKDDTSLIPIVLVRVSLEIAAEFLNNDDVGLSKEYSDRYLAVLYQVLEEKARIVATESRDRKQLRQLLGMMPVTNSSDL
eukprot:TRINITY_DN7151_c0_g1_i1.p1 TRINITY_DN7151_c0_g1~~TRINITY_DN7151_c0_g1_i1.p1  ORF type:complete len:1153 (+),score=186.70 TRINITY_DN7151_c0_g1_i1:93-3551(+)